MNGPFPALGNGGFAELARTTARNTGMRAGGIVLLILVAALCAALATWSVNDPSLSHATSAQAENLLGYPGSIVSDLLIQLFGLAAIILPLPFAVWAIKLVRAAPVHSVPRKLLMVLGAIAAGTLYASCIPSPGSWPLPTGLGGVLGDLVLSLPLYFIPESMVGIVKVVVAIAALAAMALALKQSADWSGLLRTPVAEGGPVGEMDVPHLQPIHGNSVPDYADDDEDADQSGDGFWSKLALIYGASAHTAYSVWARMRRLRGWLDRFSGKSEEFEELQNHERHEPTLNVERAHHPDVHIPSAVNYEAPIEQSAQPIQPQPTAAQRESRIHGSRSKLEQGRRKASEAQPSFFNNGSFEFPPLRLLAEAPQHSANTISAEALDQNARLLESVLEDFGVKGEIINVRPGPVVTLYELEPAPGTKSSRVIGLADDIARSMSAVSARVAVVSGRNAIGIELPNSNRDTVFLSELLGSVDFEKNKSRLPLCLGKTIGGEPVIADLARMPHLLIAGTTGSGKSVAINTMILSILYRLSPEQCKLIMVDPKMLELSVYDGIPHLLAPVVTDPNKAVVALKWTVREMEDRYRKMSKVGVRNIDGFNQKVAQAGPDGEVYTRQVQTGFDPNTGQPIFETEEMALEPMPYIVVIIDEMADLMMVAGKEIEGAVQRLAQMARAAGIHVVMATQRPSVDVITGTIKANFPTRISFQVTSKIDSRTILGEQGAEQLLGQGDMLYMMGGGRITRVHGPFCSDEEVEDIVAHLKTQGAPDYLDAITEEPEDGAYELPGADSGNSGNELYDQAVAIVLRDRKASTSYVQRRLSIGYNRAATLIEKMEEEGVISRPNSKGQREILVGEDA